jgi:hypothetical protein
VLRVKGTRATASATFTRYSPGSSLSGDAVTK